MEMIDLHIGIATHDFAQHFHTLFDREQRRFLFLVLQNRHNQPAKEPGTTLNEVQVSAGDGIERPGIDRDNTSRLGSQYFSFRWSLYDSSEKIAGAAGSILRTGCRPLRWRRNRGRSLTLSIA